jgi:L-asparaginase
MKPLVEIIALGGTIASLPRTDAAGVFPDLTAQDLVDAVPAVGKVARVRARTFAAVPSVEIDFALLQRVAALIAELEADGVAGVVITQGTDTIEETAYVLDLLHAGRCPVVVTGAMRNPSLPGPDGPANIFSAVACAADEAFRDAGVVVVMNDTIHAAAWVRKRDTSSVGAFGTPAPVGWMAEGKPALYARPLRRPAIRIPAGAVAPYVPILKPGIGDPPRLVEAALELGALGMVAELSGGGHASGAWADKLGVAAASVPVVFASRTGGGRVLENTYGQTGAEIDLIGRGLIPAGDLDSLKARLLLSLLLMGGMTERFAGYANLSWDDAA